MTRSVLITGCSDGGLGAALAIAFQKAGLLVYATARNPAKMNEVKVAVARLSYSMFPQRNQLLPVYLKFQALTS